MRRCVFIFSSTALITCSFTCYADIQLPSKVIKQDQFIYTRFSPDPNVSFYDYAPEVLLDQGVYHLYWCGGVAGDFILHAQSSAMDGPYHASNSGVINSYEVALSPSGGANFDSLHTCDPSVIKNGDVYYLYYGGLGPANKTAIGVAASRDGIHFARLNDGNPIVTPAMTAASPVNTYGAGQPSVLYMKPYFYLAFTDTTGIGVNPLNGAGQFLIRSTDPTFQSAVSEFTGNGWASRTPGKHTSEHKILEAFGIDWMYDALSGKILVASNQDPKQTYIYVLDPNRFLTLGTLSIPGTWRDGPSLLKNQDHTASTRPTCQSLELAVFKGDSKDPVPNHFETWDISLSDAMFELPNVWCRK